MHGSTTAVGAAVLAAVLVFPGCGEPETPEEAVRSCVARFLSAVEDEDGSDAADEVSWATVDLFHDIRDLAWEADRAALRRESPATRIAVLATRYRFSRGKVRGMDGRELFAAAISDGWLTPYFDEEVEIRAVEFDAGSARIQVGRPGAREVGDLQLVDEDGDWRIDLAASLPEADAGVADVIRYTGAPDEEAMQFILGLQFGSEPDASLWDPLVDAD